jgi:hypothetical protein
MTGVSVTAIVISVFLISTIVSAPLSRRLRRRRKRLFDRGIFGWESWENPIEQGFDPIGIETDRRKPDGAPSGHAVQPSARKGAMLRSSGARGSARTVVSIAAGSLAGRDPLPIAYPDRCECDFPATSAVTGKGGRAVERRSSK